MLKLAVVPVQVDVLAGCVVIEILAVFTVSKAVFEFTLVVGQPPDTTQRHRLPFMPAVTAVSVSEAVVTAGDKLDHVAPPLVLTCQL